jgi:2'-5' RNA ligase
MAQSALIIRVPEAEPLVQSLRERFDPSAAQGVPAHITILYPFMPPERISEDVLTTIRQTLSKMAPFDFRLSGVGRFPATVYLVPQPAEPFVELTQCLVLRFPEYPPYGGEHQDVVPHLTVAHGDPRQVTAAEAELSRVLQTRPDIHCHCKEAVLLENSAGMWRPMRIFELPSDKHEGMTLHRTDGLRAD